MLIPFQKYRKKQRFTDANETTPPGVGIFEVLEQRVLLSGTTFIVNSLQDTAALDGLLTLREAVQAANTNLAVNEAPAGTAATTGVDIITFDQTALAAEAGVAVGQPLSITLNGASLLITEDLDIQGLGADLLTIDAAQQSRAFIIATQTNVQLADITLTGGYTTGSGGAIHNSGAITVTRSTISNNTVDTYGGAIYNTGTLTLANATINNNTSNFRGGAIYNSFNSSVTVVDSILAANTATSEGAAVNNNSVFTLINSIVVANTSQTSSGGLYNSFHGTLTLTNSTVTGNGAATTGAGIFNSAGALTLNNTLVALNQAPASTDIDGAFINNSSLVGVDPYFVRNPSPGPDALYATLDDDLGDLRLTSTSLAIDGGDDALALDPQGAPLTTDLDGAIRVFGESVDMGAYEFQVVTPPRETPSTVVNSLADTVNATDNLISLREAIIYASILDQDITFDNTLTAGTITLSSKELSLYQSITIDATSIGGITIDAANQSRVITVANTEINVFLINLTLTGGFTDGHGGGIYNIGAVTLDHTTVTANTSTSSGGGVYNEFGALTLQHSTVTGNTSATRGAGIYNDFGTTILTNSTVVANTSTDSGAGIYIDYGDVTLTNSTVAANHAASSSGGIHINQGNLTLNNTIVALNEATNINDINGTFTSHFSLVSADPAFTRNPSPGIDAQWGTADDDFGDLRLSPISFAINRGNTFLAIDDAGLPLTTDLDGAARLSDVSVDIGAYEFQGVPLLREPLSTQVTTLIDTVDTSDNVISLREAIVYATTLQQNVTFASHLSGGTITLSLNELSIYHPLTIDATGLDSLAIDAAHLSRVMTIANRDIHVELINLTLTNGLTTGNGGGIYNTGTLALTQTTVTANESSFNGGGIYNFGTLTLTDATVSANASASGGGIHNDKNSTLTINGSTIKANTSTTSGGGITNNNSTLTLNDSTLTANIATTDGGAIANLSSGTITMSDSTLANNAANVAGALFNDSTSTTTITGANITANTATSDGGAIYNHNILAITSSTLTANTSANDGGAIYNNTGTLTLANSTVVANSATSRGGAIYNHTAALTLNNSTVVANASTTASGGIHNHDGAAALNNTIVALSQSPTNIDIIGPFTGAKSLIGVAPDFIRNPSPGPDGLYATTDDDLGDLHLADTSLAINRGETSLARDGSDAPLTTDLDDAPRISDDHVDIGAYEFQGAPAPLRDDASTEVTTLNDEINTTDEAISLREAILYASLLQLNVTFDTELIGNVITLNANAITLYHSITIDGAAIENLTVDAASQSRVIAIASQDITVTLTHLTLTGGFTQDVGAGIYNPWDNTLILNNATISGNTADSFGGGVYNAGTLNLNNATITDNTSSLHGGGIYNSNTLTSSNSSITHNTAGHGGGIYNNLGDITLKQSSVSNNTTHVGFILGLGAGIYNNGTASLINVTLAANHTDNDGAAITNFGGDMTITQSLIVGNTARGMAAIHNTGLDPNHSLTINQTTITHNTAITLVGGISTQYPTMTVNNSIIALNTSPNYADTFGAFTSNNNLITTDPRFIRNPSPGADGIWATDDDDLGDLRLLFFSPAVNRGDNNLLPSDIHDLNSNNDITEPLPLDLAGKSRINIDTVDIGAYEYHQATLGDLNDDGTIDIIDVDLLSEAINAQSQSPQYDLNTDGQITPADGLHLVENIINTLLADFNLDKQVDVRDLSTWATGFGKSSALFSQGDTNFDGQIDVRDLSTWAVQFGKTASPPEPITSPITQSSQTTSDTYILDTTPTTPTPQPLTPHFADSEDDQPDRWDNIKNLLKPNAYSPPNQQLDIIKNITSPI